MIRVKYNLQTTKVEGYFPKKIEYPNNIINEENRTIDGSPFIEITPEAHSAGLGKQMCVINGVFQEYIESTSVLLEKAKANKVNLIKKAREEFQYRDITINSRTYKASETAKLKFFAQLITTSDADFPMRWLLSDNLTWVELSKIQAYNLLNRFKEQEASAYQQQSDKLRELDRATNIREVENINTDYI